MSCRVNVDVDYWSGQPAGFASVTVYEVRGFLWWFNFIWVASKTADFVGKTWFDLAKDKTYRIRASAGGKTREVDRKPSYCPYPIGIVLPQ